MTQIFDNVGNLVMDLAASAAAGAIAGAALGVAKPANLAKVLAGAAAASAFAKALAKPPEPSTVSNKKIDDHYELGNEYLVQVQSDAAGSYKAKSIDPKALGTVAATVTKDGKYSVVQHDATGNKNQVVSGGEKKAVDSSTSTVTGHVDAAAGGGTRTVSEKGDHKETAGASTGATNGTKVEATKTSQQNVAQGGDGRHVMKGDQAFINDTGGMHYEITKGYAINTKDSFSVSALKEILINTKGNITQHSDKKLTIDADNDITINSKTKITLAVGNNKIVITPAGMAISTEAGPIYIAARNHDLHLSAELYAGLSSFSKDVTLTAEKGTVETKAKPTIGTKIQGGGTVSPPTTFK
jgi:hypothetical protein